MTGASFTSAYLFASGAGTPSGTSLIRSVIRIRVISSWLLWIAGVAYAYSQ